MSELTLNNGVTIPQLGFGVFQVPAEDTQRIVEDALAAGYQQAELATKCRSLGIAVEAYSPLGQGRDLSGNAVTAVASFTQL
jgi:diketogulonate reductase-like aldo/keto reductase